MSSTYSDLKIELIATGEQSGSWGTTTNTNLGTAIEEAITGRAEANFASDADLTLGYTDTNGAQVFRNLILNVTGTISTTRNLIVPTINKVYIVENNTTGSQDIVVKTSAGTGITVPNGSTTVVYADGTNVVSGVDYIDSVTLGNALAVASGGTGATTLTANNVILGNGTSAVQFVAPGTSGNLLTSNGTTWTSTAPAAGGIEYEVKTANYTASDKEGILADTSGGAFTVTLPATPSTGDQVIIADPTGDWGTNNLTIGRNGETISDVAEDLVCDISGVSVQVVYDGSTWAVYSQVGGNGGTVVTEDGTQTLTNKTLTAPVITSVDIDSGSIDGTAIGENSASTGVFTSLETTGGFTEDAEAITSSSNAATLDLSSATNFTHTLTENVTYTFSNPATSGKTSAFTLKVTQDSTARTITWPASVEWAGGEAPTISDTDGYVDYFVFITTDGGTAYYGFTAGQAME